MSNETICYTIGLNLVSSSNQYLPCGVPSASGAQSCCFAGDYCLDDSICHYTHFVTNGTGYYMAGCTDPTWQDPSCPKQCTSEYSADIIYDTTNQHWDCCTSTSDSLDCQNPSPFRVDAPGPDSLFVVQQLSTPGPSPASVTAIGSISSIGPDTPLSGQQTSITPSGGSVAGSTSTPATAQAPSTISPAASANPTAPSTDAASSSTATATSSSELSGGAKAGIAIGVILGALLLALALFFVDRRRRIRKAHEARGSYGGIDSPVDGRSTPARGGGGGAPFPPPPPDDGMVSLTSPVGVAHHDMQQRRAMYRGAHAPGEWPVRPRNAQMVLEKSLRPAEVLELEGTPPSLAELPGNKFG